MSVLAGEWIKFRSHRAAMFIGVAALAAALGFSAIAVMLLKDEFKRNALSAATLATTMPAVGAYAASLMCGVAASIWLTAEFTSGSNYLTLVTVPSRRVVFAARAVLLLALGIALGMSVSATGAASIVLAMGSGALTEAGKNSSFWWNFVLTPTLCAMVTGICLSVATVVRRPLATLGALATVFVLLPNAAAAASLLGAPRVLCWVLEAFPGSLISDVLTASAPGAGAGALASLSAGLVLAAWTTVFVLGAGWHFERH